MPAVPGGPDFILVRRPSLKLNANSTVHRWDCAVLGRTDRRTHWPLSGDPAVAAAEARGAKGCCVCGTCVHNAPRTDPDDGRDAICFALDGFAHAAARRAAL